MIRVIVWFTINLVFRQELRDPEFSFGSWEDIGKDLADEGEDGGVDFALDGLQLALLWVSPLAVLMALVMRWSLIATVPLFVVFAGEFGALTAVAVRKLRVRFCGAPSGIGIADEAWALVFTSSYVAVVLSGWVWPIWG